jgi:signal transduction histidine kinase
MTWLDILWLMMGGASLTLAATHLLIGLRPPRQPAHVMFALAALSVAVLSVLELMLMRATDPAQFGTLLRWAHVPVATLAVAIVGFVRLQFDAGRLWLGGLVCATRVGSLIPNFFAGANINFASVDSLSYVTVWGAGQLANPVGTINPWMAMAQLSNLLVVAYVLDALLTIRRRGDPALTRRAAIICGSIALFVVIAGSWSISLALDLADGPWTVNAAFFVVVLAMSYDLGGDVVRAAGLSRELAASQASLHESEQRLHLAARAAGLGVWTWDVASGRYWFTDTGHSLLGLELEDRLTREQLLGLIHAEDVTGVLAARDEALEGSGEFACEFRLAEQPDRWLAAMGGIEREAAADPGVVRGVLLEVTDRRRMEQETAMQRDELAHLSRVAMLGELSGSIAHELNQPLTAVLSNAQAALRFLLHDPPNLGEVRDSLAGIVENDKRAADVIRRLRTMLRKEPPEYQVLDVNEILLDMLRLINSDLLNRGVAVAQELQAGLPAVHGDRVQLQQVLLNLIVNACDAMDGISKDRVVTIRTGRRPDGLVEVSIMDVGPGIPDEDLDRIFEPFMTTKREGIGLGLPICRSIVRAHGGSLEAANNDGAGAALRMVLPVAPIGVTGAGKCGP